MANKKKNRKKINVRFLFVLVVFSCITAALGYNLFCNIASIKKMNVTKKQLEDKILSLKEEKEVLEGDIIKLKDPNYIAKYVREKYFYSKDGEVILRIDD